MGTQPMKVLLVEDNPGDARLFREMFTEQASHNAEVTYVATMSEAEKHVAEHAVDIIVLDLGLPDAEGLGAVRRAHAAVPHVPLVVLTGLDNEALAVHALQEGAQDYLVKGQIEARWLLRSLRYAIERKIMEIKITDDIIGLKRAEHEREVYERKLEKSNADLELLAGHLERARDEAKQATRAKSRFLAGMSHELRTPLNGILGYAQLLRLEGGLNGVQSARVAAMLGAGNHLLEIIQSVLDLSEIETEHVELQMTQVDLRRIAAACLDLVRPTAEAKRPALGLAMALDVPPLVMTDPRRLRQILLNLLGNAVKFTVEGAVELRLRTTADGARLRFEVADTGPGIPVEQRHRLFEEFERLDSVAARTAEGAGLGLSLAAQLAALMSGRVGHEDNPTGGSVFWLELPLILSNAAVALPTPATAPDMTDAQPAPIPVRALRVLVADDVAMNRDIAASFIRAAGHEVICVEDGADAVAAVATTDFDVVMMDVRMPIVDGLEATRRIRALEGVRGQVPIVAMTAQAFSEQVWECRRAGMDCHVAKPFTLNSLLEALARGFAAGRYRADASEQSGGPVRLELREPTPSAGRTPTGVPAADTLGSEQPIFDVARFARTTGLLETEAVACYMRNLAVQGEALLRGLHAPDALVATRGVLAEAAHTLAGSAGMFGFERLASVGRRFEHAVQTDAAEALAIAESLGAALEASLPEMHSRTLVAVEP